MRPDCPLCQEVDLSAPLYELSGVPVQSVRLFDNFESARRISAGSLNIVQCRECGIVFNRAFDPGTQHWDVGYEETQAYSTQFTHFSDSLAEHLVDRWQIRNKKVLEVGCGKGHFLMEICRIGDNQGLGIDPAHDPARIRDDSGAVTFKQELLGHEHMDFEPDLIVCRHTLEHLANPQQVLSILATRPGVPVFFDVPDFERILNEGAFWDLYYEHCNYFDIDSFEQLFTRQGFVTEELSRGFNDQYLMYFGYTGAESPRTQKDEVEQKSGGRFEQAKGQWIRQIMKWHESGQSVMLWGGGSKAVGFLSGIGKSAGDAVQAVVDINPHKQGRFLPGFGHPVLAPDQLSGNPPDHIVLMNPVYRPEVEELLKRFDVNARLTAVNRI